MKQFIPQIGGHPLKNDDLVLIQNSYKELFGSVLSSINSATNLILSGVSISVVTTTVTYTSGFVYWSGEIFRVPGGTFTYDPTKNYFLYIVTTTLAPSPETYADGAVLIAHVDRTMSVGYYDISYQGEYYTNFTRISLDGVKSLSIIEWFGNITVSFDNTGLGLGDMLGYAICNGNNGTPDMRGFLSLMPTNVPNTGAPALNAKINNSYDNITAYGSESVTLTQANLPNVTLEPEDPGHSHIEQVATAINTGGRNPAGFDQIQPGSFGPTSFSTGESTTGITVPLGGTDAPFQIIPPVFTVVKIMKL